jgi:hypothetical protein
MPPLVREEPKSYSLDALLPATQRLRPDDHLCGPVQLVLETGGPDMSGMFSVKWLTRSPLLLLAKLVQCVSRIADFTR